MEEVPRKEGFQLRRDPNFLLDTDRFLTAIGAPVVLARNYAGYASLGRPRQGRWGIGDKEETPFKMASAFLKDRRDLCVPVELLAGLIDEDSKLRNSTRSWDMPDTVCSDLSWPGSCLENLTAGCLDAASHCPPLLVHASGPQNSHLTLLRPRPTCFGGASPSATAAVRGDEKGFYGTTAAASCGLHPEAAAAAAAAAAVTPNASAEVELEDRVALHAGPIRQISKLASRVGVPPGVFARCDYSATLVKACKVVDRLQHPGARGSRAVCERRIRRAKVAAGVPIAVEDAASLAPATEEEENGVDSGLDYDGFVEEEKLVFSKRLTAAASSPFTPKHAAFLDEELRVFQWHADRGATTYGPGPLPIAAPSVAENPRSEAEARRSRNADVAIDYGSHPRTLWIAGRHRAYRVDLREKPSPAALKPALDPGVYYKSFSKNQIVEGGCGKLGGRGEEPKIRSLVVGRHSAYDVFLAAGLHLACMDVRFPRSVVVRWDLPQEVDQLRWLPGVPGEGDHAEEVILASGRRSPGYYANTWARESPGWRGCEIRLGLDDTSPSTWAARRPLTFSLPATPLSEGETRSGGLFVNLPPERGPAGGGGGGDGLWIVNATSAGDVYGQRLKVGRIGGEDQVRGRRGSGVEENTAVPATPRSALLSSRIQSMLPCGDVCLDPDPKQHLPVGHKTTAVKKTSQAFAAATTGPARCTDPEGRSKDGHCRGGVSEHRDANASGKGGSGSRRRTGRTRRTSSETSDVSGGSSDDSGWGSESRVERCREEGVNQPSSVVGDADNRDSDCSDTSVGKGGTNVGIDSDRSSARCGQGKRSAREGSRDSRNMEQNEGSGGESSLDNDEDSSSGGDGSSGDSGWGNLDRSGGKGGPSILTQPRGTKRPRRDETRRKARNLANNSTTAEEMSGGGGGGGGCHVDEKLVRYYPVNAGALRAAVEKVPDSALCGHRHLAPLVDLVSTAAKGTPPPSAGASSEREVKATGPAALDATSAAARQRERDFSLLRDNKDEVADFLLKPKTPEELLTFCRRTLGLEFPSDPTSDLPSKHPPDTERKLGEEEEEEEEGRGRGGNHGIFLPTSSGLGRPSSRSARCTTAQDEGGAMPSVADHAGSGRTHGASGTGALGRANRRRIDDSAVAADVARAVLAWGQPFRDIETAWRVAAAGQAYSVVSSSSSSSSSQPPLLTPRPLPKVNTLVLCSAREVLKGEPSPLLRPGTFGTPLAVDVTVEDVRCLKDEWDTNWCRR